MSTFLKLKFVFCRLNLGFLQPYYKFYVNTYWVVKVKIKQEISLSEYEKVAVNCSHS